MLPSYLYHEVQNGATYDVSINFSPVLPSVKEVNSLIVKIAGTGNQLKFNNISIR
jgi:hypothetical protein